MSSWSRGGPEADWARDRALLRRALGLPDNAARGDRALFTTDDRGPEAGVVYFANANTIGVRAKDALYRFLRGFGGPVVASHHLFAEDTDPDQSRHAWEAWLARTLA